MTFPVVRIIQEVIKAFHPSVSIITLLLLSWWELSMLKGLCVGMARYCRCASSLGSLPYKGQRPLTESWDPQASWRVSCPYCEMTWSKSYHSQPPCSPQCRPGRHCDELSSLISLISDGRCRFKDRTYATEPLCILLSHSSREVQPPCFRPQVSPLVRTSPDCIGQLLHA